MPDKKQTLGPEDTPYFKWANEFYEKLIGYCARRTGSKKKAETFAYEAVRAASERSPEYYAANGGKNRFRRKTFLIARNKIVDEYRRTRRATSLNFDPPCDLLILPQDPVVADALYTCFNHLPDNQRLCLGMREICGLTSEEIGRWVGLDDGYVRNIIDKAEESLRDCMQKRGIGPDDVF